MYNACRLHATTCMAHTTPQRATRQHSVTANAPDVSTLVPRRLVLHVSRKCARDLAETEDPRPRDRYQTSNTVPLRHNLHVDGTSDTSSASSSRPETIPTSCAPIPACV